MPILRPGCEARRAAILSRAAAPAARAYPSRPRWRGRSVRSGSARRAARRRRVSGTDLILRWQADELTEEQTAGEWEKTRTTLREVVLISDPDGDPHVGRALIARPAVRFSRPRLTVRIVRPQSSEQRRVGKEGVSTGRSRGEQDH